MLWPEENPQLALEWPRINQPDKLVAPQTLLYDREVMEWRLRNPEDRPKLAWPVVKRGPLIDKDWRGGAPSKTVSRPEEPPKWPPWT